MNKDIQRFDDIQNYLDNKMSAEERQAFEAQMATDTGLADEVGAHRLEREMMDIMLEDDLAVQLESWKQEKAQAMQPQRSRWWRWGILVIVIIALLLYVLQNRSKNENPLPANDTQQLDNSTPTENNMPPKEAPAKKKYNGPVAGSEKKASDKNVNQAEMIALAEELGGTPEFAGTFVRSGEEAKTRFDSAAVLIQEKRYDAAIRLLQNIPNDDPEVYLNARLNLGYLYFVKKNFKASIPHLEFAAANKDYLYSETAEWYLLLAYLADGQRIKFDSKLEAILGDTAHTYYEKAVQLKDELE